MTTNNKNKVSPQKSFSEKIGSSLMTIREYLGNLLDLREDTDKAGTIESINKYIQLRGYNVWILICSAVIASIGLDLNSSAVIIGAMLISPLMSPILGIGLSIGINDRQTLSLSIQNFLIAIFVSILASFIYFNITPLGYLTAELAARTKPTPMDVGVALFGGIAGIVAGSHKDKTNALPGVAIATALMPPLCTAGYGLAKGNIAVFGGALYLFFINAVIISVTTYLVVRYLKFPQKEYVNPKDERNTSVFIGIVVFLVVIPSFFILLDILQQINTSNKVRQFITEKINDDKHEAFEWELDEVAIDSSVLKIYIGGEESLSDERIAELQQQVNEVENLETVHLRLIQTGFSKDKLDRMRNEIDARMRETMEVTQQMVEEQNKQIVALQSKVNLLKADSIPLQAIKTELRALYPEITTIEAGFNNVVQFVENDSTQKEVQLKLPKLSFAWKEKLKNKEITAIEQRIYGFLKVRHQFDTLVIARIGTK